MKAILPETIAPPFANYSHGIALPPGQRLVRTSGQLGLAPDGAVPDAPDQQATICFDNIRAILADADMTPHDVFHVTAYVTDRAYFAGYMTARDAFLDGVAVRPTSTLLIVAGFTRPEFLVEVEVWAAAS